MDGKINGCESFRDASFSYLRSEQTTAQRASTSARTSFGTDRRATTKASELHEGEISVFGAERYFNTPVHDHSTRPKPLKTLPGIADGAASARPVTPSACSEGSTMLLLKSASANAAKAGAKPRSWPRRWLVEGSRSLFATLGCTGTCSDDKSIFVADGAGNKDEKQGLGQGKDHNNHGHNPNRLRYEVRSTKRTEEHFAFPILSDNAEKAAAEESEAAEPPRMSLEVFRSKSSGVVVDEVAVNLERKLSVLTWDAIPAAKPHGGGSKVSPRTARAAEDIDSDASSDLFEIENITARRVSDDIAATSLSNNGGYEPSEASIEWSVVTASAAADLGSEYDEKKLSANTAKASVPAPKRRPGIGMLGCKSQKSVRVAETAQMATTASTKGD